MPTLEKLSKSEPIIIKGNFTIRNDIDCPECSFHHIDKDDWSKRLHRKHLCEQCGHIWQPEEGYTFGI